MNPPFKRRLAAAVVGGGVVAGTATATYLGLVTGRLSVDLGVGRRMRPLGPLVVDIVAPREVVYAAATAPYAQRQTRAMREKVQILDRADGMVLAAHRTPIGGGLVAITVETVTFEPPARIGFRLVRGPVPFVAETFELTDIPVETGTGALWDRWRHAPDLYRPARHRPWPGRTAVGRPGRPQLGRRRRRLTRGHPDRERTPSPLSTIPHRPKALLLCERRHRRVAGPVATVGSKGQPTVHPQEEP